MDRKRQGWVLHRKSIANKNMWKRKNQANSDDEEQDDNTSSLLYKKKAIAPADNKLRFSSSTSRPSDKPEMEEAESEVVFKFESSSSIQVENDNRATAVLETETEFDRDARAIREKVMKQAEASLKEDEKLYKGIHGYKDYNAGFRREHTVASEKASGAHGPLRASAHIRVSARFDYQPDICKDYRETGYCGYGDSCKFMHDRGDYKSGWQMEREWERTQSRYGPWPMAEKETLYFASKKITTPVLHDIVQSQSTHGKFLLNMEDGMTVTPLPLINAIAFNLNYWYTQSGPSNQSEVGSEVPLLSPPHAYTVPVSDCRGCDCIVNSLYVILVGFANLIYMFALTGAALYVAVGILLVMFAVGLLYVWGFISTYNLLKTKVEELLVTNFYGWMARDRRNVS